MIGQTENPDTVRRTRVWSASVAALLLCAAPGALPADADPSAPVRLAVFDFEIEDASAAAFATEAADTSRIREVTAEIRQLFAQSGRYLLVDVSGADGDAGRTHKLRECDGCDAVIALKRGAEQSFVGVVKRITRTEYVIRFRIRDARTGAVVSAATSDLRMGADYSWARGAARLIRERLLEGQVQR